MQIRILVADMERDKFKVAKKGKTKRISAEQGRKEGIEIGTVNSEYIHQSPDSGITTRKFHSPSIENFTSLYS